MQSNTRVCWCCVFSAPTLLLFAFFHTTVRSLCGTDECGGKEEETGDKKRKKILFGQCNNNVFVNSAYLAIVDQN